MNDFIEDENSNGDIYGYEDILDWEPADDFDVETGSPYVDPESGVLIDPSLPQDVQDALRSMGLDYNRSSDEKRLASLQDKYGDMSLDEYNVITSILGSDLYLMLKEAQYLDSAQIIDEILSFNMNVTPEEVERALLSMVSDINNIETQNIQIVLDAMDLGFSLEEAIELTDVDVIQNLLPEEGISELRDRIMHEIEQTEIRRQLEQELREQGEQFRRRN